jgi:class I fructose-bisphosphate aldolase
MGAVAVGATIYFGSPQSDRQIQEISTAFRMAHEKGMATILWCYLRNTAFSTEAQDYHTSADLTGQANYLGVSIGADIIKQKLPAVNGGYPAVNASEKFGRYDERMYSELSSQHPIDLVRYQVANNYMGRIGLINSGGASTQNDLARAVRTAVVNKRGGGMGLISGRKAFQKEFDVGVELLHAIQDVYLMKEISVA